MNLDNVDAKALRGCKFYASPDSPTLGILRLDTDDGPHYFLVDRKRLHLLAEASAKCAEEVRPLA